MYMHLHEVEKETRDYCRKNSLNFSKIQSMGKSCGKDIIGIQYFDPSKGTSGLRDETPAPVVLIIKRDATGNVTFQQTEHTNKHLK